MFEKKNLQPLERNRAWIEHNPIGRWVGDSTLGETFEKMRERNIRKMRRASQGIRVGSRKG